LAATARLLIFIYGGTKIYGVTWLIVALHLSCIPLAFVYSHILEWVFHKYVLHGLGKKKNSPWASHWHTHHRRSRHNDNYDKDYTKGFSDKTVRSEILGLGFLSITHIPTFFISPIFYLALVASGIRYYQVHRRSHLDIKWCKEHLPWHYDHHMGRNQDANWGVTTDWIDRLVGTRVSNTDKQS